MTGGGGLDCGDPSCHSHHSARWLRGVDVDLDVAKLKDAWSSRKLDRKVAATDGLGAIDGHEPPGIVGRVKGVLR